MNGRTATSRAANRKARTGRRRTGCLRRRPLASRLARFFRLRVFDVGCRRRRRRPCGACRYARRRFRRRTAERNVATADVSPPWKANDRTDGEWRFARSSTSLEFESESNWRLARDENPLAKWSAASAANACHRSVIGERRSASDRRRDDDYGADRRKWRHSTRRVGECPTRWSASRREA